MTVSITNWHAARAKVAEIREVCEAFQRGDQPDKTRLTSEQIKDLYLTTRALVAFCGASFEKRRGSGSISFAESETYMYAKSYSRTMTQQLLRKGVITLAEATEAREWLQILPTLPSVRMEYV